jgi:hypothetical protein
MEYDSVAPASICPEDFLLDVFREEIIFESLSGRIDLLSESLCCLLEKSHHAQAPCGLRARIQS